MLSDITIRNARPKEMAFKLYDEKGLYLIVQPTGGKLWRFDYRFFGKRKTLALGSYPDVSLASARDGRDEARRHVASDIDPSDLRRATREARVGAANNSFEVIAREWISTHMADKTPSHTSRLLRRLVLYIFPWLGNKPISDITAPQLLESIRRIQNANKLETAHRTLQSVGQIFRYAAQTGRAARDITLDLKGALPPATTKHMAAFTEPSQVAGLLKAIDGFTGTLTVQAALKLAPLVFVRPGELRTARWADIDLDASEWKYRVSKTNTDHIVPLSNQALAILQDIHPLSGHGEFVFMGGHDSRKPMSDAALNASLKRMGYDTQTEITGHGFRAMARTILHERLGVDPYIIEHQLAHKVPDALGSAYNRTKFLEQRKVMMQQWADYLDELKAS
jgi:integrase